MDGGAAGRAGFVLVQSYVRNQFLYDNRPSYLRLWVVVTSVQPLRAHLFRGGVLVFGDRLEGIGGGGGGAAPRRRRHRRARAQRAGDAAPHVNKSAAAVAVTSARGGAPRRLRAVGEEPRDARVRTRAYETHVVNYWTITGEKLPPWTVAQLRSHAARAFPQARGKPQSTANKVHCPALATQYTRRAAVRAYGRPCAQDPAMWDRGWAAAREAVGMVLASASDRMRTAARSLGALGGCGAWHV